MNAQVAGGGPGWRFPSVLGRDLLGNDYRLPEAFPAQVTVAVLAFKQWQQGQVDAWIGALADAGLPSTPLGAQNLERLVVELPVISGRYQPFRRFIDGGMATSIRDPQVLARTITIYGSVDAVCTPLRILSREAVSVRAVQRDGTVLWGTTGAASDHAVADLLARLAA